MVGGLLGQCRALTITEATTGANVFPTIDLEGMTLDELLTVRESTLPVVAKAEKCHRRFAGCFTESSKSWRRGLPVVASHCKRSRRHLLPRALMQLLVLLKANWIFERE